MSEERVFVHGGKAGDCILHLSAIEQMGGGALRLWPCPHTGGPAWSSEFVNKLRPLLEVQPYIHKVGFSNNGPQSGEIELDVWRWRYKNNLNIADNLHDALGMEYYPRHKSWLTVPDPIRVSRVLFARCPRYRNDRMPWRYVYEFYKQYKPVFVGLPDEHRELQDMVGPLAYYPTSDYLTLARVIAGCDLFVSNQSSPHAIAEALKKPKLLEVCLNDNNCHWGRDGAAYVYNGSENLPEVMPAVGNGRRHWIERVLAMFRERRGRRVVEIGSIRPGHNAEGDGHATMAWATTAAEVYSVDIDPTATDLTRRLTASYGVVSAVTMDGIAFLDNFHQPIDLLYLDGWDVGTECFAERHLEAYRAAAKNLHKNSLILIDDTHEGGKGELVIPAAKEDGWNVVFQDYMTLLADPVKQP
jgi:hypothetical protein